MTKPGEKALVQVSSEDYQLKILKILFITLLTQIGEQPLAFSGTFQPGTQIISRHHSGECRKVFMKQMLHRQRWLC